MKAMQMQRQQRLNSQKLLQRMTLNLQRLQMQQVVLKMAELMDRLYSLKTTKKPEIIFLSQVLQKWYRTVLLTRRLKTMDSFFGIIVIQGPAEMQDLFYFRKRFAMRILRKYKDNRALRLCYHLHILTGVTKFFYECSRLVFLYSSNLAK